MDIITALGIDSTLWMQLGIFVISYALLKTIALNPYFKAFEKRQGLTSGNQTRAEQIFTQTRELESLYQRKLRGLNGDTKAFFDKARLEAASEQEKVQAAARETARVTIEKARAKIEEQIHIAREDLIKETPELSRTIASRLLPREVQ